MSMSIRHNSWILTTVTSYFRTSTVAPPDGNVVAVRVMTRTSPLRRRWLKVRRTSPRRTTNLSMMRTESPPHSHHPPTDNSSTTLNYTRRSINTPDRWVAEGFMTNKFISVYKITDDSMLFCILEPDALKWFTVSLKTHLFRISYGI